jgi:DNA polymerase bacteriophage-type
MIRIKLPSGRRLHYLNCTIEEVTAAGNDGRPWIQEQIYYDGIEHSATTDADGKQEKKKHKWGRVKTYGGKLCENVVQAFCRDAFFHCVMLAWKMGFEIFGRFHDEAAALRSANDFGLGLAELKWCMSQPPPNSPDFPNGAEGFTTPFYRKG